VPLGLKIPYRSRFIPGQALGKREKRSPLRTILLKLTGQKEGGGLRGSDQKKERGNLLEAV